MEELKNLNTSLPDSQTDKLNRSESGFLLNEQLPQSQVIDPNMCIILHPGSRYLRLGKPSDFVPCTVLHAIGRKMKMSSFKSKRSDSHIVPLAKMSSEKVQEIEECRLKVGHILQSCLKSDGTRRFATPSKQLATHNRRATPRIKDEEPLCPSLLQPQEDYVVGDEVLEISPSAPYHIIYPWQRGDVYVHSGVNGSLTAVMADLQTIWTHSIRKKLGIDPKTFKVI